MTEGFVSRIKDELCPDGIWRFSDRVRKVLQREINRLPNENVSKEEAMYPSTASGMREFLEVFFSRHYFKVRNSLLDYAESEDFDSVLDGGEIRILDIGCGLAVGVLATTDIIMCLLENQNNPRRHSVRVTYVLNDTSEICLAVGWQMLDEYFGRYHSGTSEHRILTLASDFPDNTRQLGRIASNYGAYHLVMLSYVVRPLVDENGTVGLANDIVRIEKLCDPLGRILILQDQYRETLMRALVKQIDTSVENKELTQEIFPNRGTGDTYTYSYYQCLYKPCLGERNARSRLAEAVAGRA
jgi:hypothetical protein